MSSPETPDSLNENLQRLYSDHAREQAVDAIIDTLIAFLGKTDDDISEEERDVYEYLGEMAYDASMTHDPEAELNTLTEFLVRSERANIPLPPLEAFLTYMGFVIPPPDQQRIKRALASIEAENVLTRRARNLLEELATAHGVDDLAFLDKLAQLMMLATKLSGERQSTAIQSLFDALRSNNTPPATYHLTQEAFEIFLNS